MDQLHRVLQETKNLERPLGEMGGECRFCVASRGEVPPLSSSRLHKCSSDQVSRKGSACSLCLEGQSTDVW